jgi:uncharacterized SAM-binding protein YcdF (DUF218 family)
MFDKFVIALISPLGTALALGVAALLLARFKKSRLGWVAGLFALVWLGVWSLPLTSHLLRGALEAQFPPVAVNVLPKAQAIVVLGGTMRPAEMLGQLPDLRESADRVWHAARLFHAGKAPLVVLSGGSNLEVIATPEAEAMSVFLSDLGVPTNTMVLEGHSRNTRQNAQFTADMLRPQGVNHILLVTSALHMRRAVALFEAQGFAVTPAATDHEARHRFDWDDALPDAGALDGSARAMKEIVGRMVGR